MAESTLELGPIQNEVPEEHLQTLLDTLPPFQLRQFAQFQAVLRLFEAREAGKHNGKKRKRSSEKPASPAKWAKKQALPRSLQCSAQLFATLGLLAKQE